MKPKEYLEKSKQCIWCAVINCKSNPNKKCPICSAHYCEEHIKHHLHVDKEAD